MDANNLPGPRPEAENRAFTSIRAMDLKMSSMTIAVASGKGGTGKTTVAANLASYLMDKGKSVAFVDCDVEEPNAHFFLKPEFTDTRDEYVPVPQVDHDKCLGEECRKCVDLCRFKCLIHMGGEIMVFPELCHGCGLCSLACPASAISETTRTVGETSVAEGPPLFFARGLMRIGEAMAPPLIGAVKKRVAELEHTPDVTLLDCPPGASCPVVESVHGVDAVLLVAEPTPFGLNDLDIAVRLMREMKLPFGVTVNRAGMGDDRVHRYLEENSIPLLGDIPASTEAARAYSEGELLIHALPELEPCFETIWKNIAALATGDEQ